MVGVLLDRGADNPALEPLWRDLPQTAGEERSIDFAVDPTTLLPDDRRTYRYPGSLTTPPCTEGVQWLLMKTPAEVSPAQVSTFKNVMEYDSRYTQPLHGRDVLEDASVDE